MVESEGLAGQVCYPVTEIVVTRRDEASIFAVKGVTDREPCLAPVTIIWKVWGLQPIPQEEARFSISHTLDCKKGSLVTARHNELRDGVVYLSGKAFTSAHVRNDPLIY